MLIYFGGRRTEDSSTVAMAIWFLLLLAHATTIASTERADWQMLDANQTSADHHMASSSSSSIKHGGRHYWHWLHKQREQEKQHQSGRSRRWREVANGDDGDNYRVMLDNDMRSHPDLLENRSADPHADENDGAEHHGDGHNGIHVASWRWDEIGIYITFTTFIIVAGLAKVGNDSLDIFPNFSFYCRE